MANSENPQSAALAPQAPPTVHSVRMVLREWLDVLIIVLVLAMFLRVFLIELYRIPSGSMAPTLIGGDVARVDYDGDGLIDLLLFQDNSDAWPLGFRNDGLRLIAQGECRLTPREIARYREQGMIDAQYDRILVNKLAYWFDPPRRGDLVVFKVPSAIWEADKPIYIKRCVGLGAEELAFDPLGHLLVNGERVLRPEFFRAQAYEVRLDRADLDQRPEIAYRTLDPFRSRIERILVPRDQIYVFGDNTASSRDSRYWGGVPLRNLKGRAFFRYFPLGQMKSLTPD